MRKCAHIHAHTLTLIHTLTCVVINTHVYTHIHTCTCTCTHCRHTWKQQTPTHSHAVALTPMHTLVGCCQCQAQQRCTEDKASRHRVLCRQRPLHQAFPTSCQGTVSFMDTYRMMVRSFVSCKMEKCWKQVMLAPYWRMWIYTQQHTCNSRYANPLQGDLFLYYNVKTSLL
jgi:hypothetical protein